VKGLGVSGRLKEAFEALGLGLSRVLRYAYPGFLLVLLASVLNPSGTEEVIKALTPQFSAVVALVVGAGLYAAHRSLVIPIHHSLLCALFYGYETVARVPSSESRSPTRWLGKEVGVKLGWRMMAYTVLRQSDLYEKDEKQALNIAHAESGLVVVTATGLLAAGVFAAAVPKNTPPVPSAILFAFSIAFLVASYPRAWAQHSLECLRMKTKRKKVEEVLRAYGLLDGSHSEENNHQTIAST